MPVRLRDVVGLTAHRIVRQRGALPRRMLWLCVGAVVFAIAVWAAPQSTAVPAGAGYGPISIDTLPVPLNPENPTESAIGDFSYAGGLVLTSSQTDQLHGLSDLEVTGTGRLMAVGDFGVFLDARLLLDDAERLVGVTDARLSLLVGEDGAPLGDKAYADAEGLAILPGGDRLVSFERHDRVLVYPVDGGPPRPAAMPRNVAFPPNGGMEALGADPETGDDAYVVGAEETGETWTCRLSSRRCDTGTTVEMADGFGLVAMKRLPGMLTMYLLRAYDPLRGNRSSLLIHRAGRLLARMDMALPMTIDNYEGVAAVPRRDGSVRFYLISDDNASSSQRTLLVAFDWWPR